jgi:bacterioferritin-associated ferredoxin
MSENEAKRQESAVYQLIESLEIQAACGQCGRLSLSVLTDGGECPHCKPGVGNEGK